jgi:hypothetical protein
VDHFLVSCDPFRKIVRGKATAKLYESLDHFTEFSTLRELFHFIWNYVYLLFPTFELNVVFSLSCETGLTGLITEVILYYYIEKTKNYSL